MSIDSAVRSRMCDWNASVLDGIDALVFDCDGVLWRGSSFIPGAIDTLKALKQMGKKVIFCSNNSTKSRKDFYDRFASQGLQVNMEDIYSSAYTTAAYIRSLPRAVFDPATQAAFVMGFTGILEELRLRGVQALDGSKVVPPNTTLADVAGATLDPRIGAVVVGLDPGLTYAKAAYACSVLRENPKCLFISTNQDKSFPSARRKLPGAGSCVAMVQAGSGRDPVNMGKPSPAMMDAIVSDHKLDRARVLMVGDRQDTDIVFANVSGVRSLLVFTGVTPESAFRREHAIAPASFAVPLAPPPPFLAAAERSVTAPDSKAGEAGGNASAAAAFGASADSDRPGASAGAGSVRGPLTETLRESHMHPYYVAASVNALIPAIEAVHRKSVETMMRKADGAVADLKISKL